MSAPQTPSLPSISTDDLLIMIGEREARLTQQRVLIAQQAARIKELESGTTEP